LAARRHGGVARRCQLDRYFGSGQHWDDPGWHVRWPEYDRKLGEPLAPYTRDGYIFTRRFEHLTVTADCESLAATFKWSE